MPDSGVCLRSVELNTSFCHRSAVFQALNVVTAQTFIKRYEYPIHGFSLIIYARCLINICSFELIFSFLSAVGLKLSVFLSTACGSVGPDD